MSSRERADLHAHSYYSDGTFSPADLVGLAAQLQLGALSLTDHDTVSGLAQAQAEARRLGVRFVPGVELTAAGNGAERHILAYWVDTGCEELVALLAKMGRTRRRRIHRIVEKLHQCSVDLDPQAVLETEHRGVLGRMHVAEALCREGFTESIQEGFGRYLRDDGPAYVPKFALDVAGTCALIHRAGGVAVLAHPGHEPDDEEIADFARSGLDGLEASYPGYRAELTEHYLELARRLDLVATGGSDFHGDRKPQGLGSVTVSMETVAQLEQRRAERYASTRPD